MTPDEQAGAPAIRVHGPATPEEVAAVVAVLAAAGGGDPEPEQPPSRWASHAAALRRPLDHGPGAWRSSYRR
jgi:hypothetical protein